MLNYLLSERGRERSGLGFWWWWREVDERGREQREREASRARGITRNSPQTLPNTRHFSHFSACISSESDDHRFSQLRDTIRAKDRDAEKLRLELRRSRNSAPQSPHGSQAASHSLNTNAEHCGATSKSAEAVSPHARSFEFMNSIEIWFRAFPLSVRGHMRNSEFELVSRCDAANIRAKTCGNLRLQATSCRGGT